MVLPRFAEQRSRTFRVALTDEVKDFLIAQESNATPRQILTMMRSLDTFSHTLPSQAQVRNFIANYRQRERRTDDTVERFQEIMSGHHFSQVSSDSDPFWFADDLDHIPTRFGNGSPGDPFFIGFSCRALFRQLQNTLGRSGTCILHVDTTFKIVSTSFPIMVAGVSTRNGGFCLLGLAITSLRTGKYWKTFLQSINLLIRRYTDTLFVTSVLGDADQAQLLAVREVYPHSIPYLMCWFHLMQNVRSKIGKSSQWPRIHCQLTKLHFAPSSPSFVSKLGEYMQQWKTSSDPMIVDWVPSFKTSWCDAPFNHWQAFWTPPGHPATNNPLESWNAKLKKVYTNRYRMRVPVVAEKFLNILREELEIAKQAHNDLVIPTRLATRMKSLDKLEAFTIKDGALPHTFHVLQAPPQQEDESIWANIAVQHFKQVANNAVSPCTAVMELVDQPADGWIVNSQLAECTCCFWLKFGFCVHTLYVQSWLHPPAPDHGGRRFYNLSPRLQRTEQPARRPRQLSPPPPHPL